MISSRVVPGSEQKIALAAPPTHDLFIAVLTNCSEKFLLVSKIEWSHCLNLTVSFSYSEPENHGMPGILLSNVVADAPSTARLPA